MRRFKVIEALSGDCFYGDNIGGVIVEETFDTVWYDFDDLNDGEYAVDDLLIVSVPSEVEEAEHVEGEIVSYHHVRLEEITS